MPNLLGTVPERVGIRDAVHCAVMSTMAAQNINPGQSVSLDVSGMGWPSSSDREPIGAADPFRSGTIERGSRFWIIMFPNTVQDLRHVWSLPAIDNNRLREVVEDDEDEDGDYDECRDC